MLRVVRVVADCVAVLRLLNTALWAALIAIYFATVDGGYQSVYCPSSDVSYCSNVYV
jgi:hypothetical protein